jgi:DNA oxidative demethylase
MASRRTRPAAIPADVPEGLVYCPGFLAPEEERALVQEIETYSFREVVMHGVAARRTVLHFGWDYDYEGWSIHPAEPPSPLLRALADRCAEVARVEPSSLEQFLVARYPPGATIGWHRDAPMFGSPVAGVSLGAPCRMRFRRKAGDCYLLHELRLEPRSLYLIGGEARMQWQHSIPPTKELRYSITMRTIKKQPPYGNSKKAPRALNQA